MGHQPENISEDGNGILTRYKKRCNILNGYQWYFMEIYGDMEKSLESSQPASGFCNNGRHEKNPTAPG